MVARSRRLRLPDTQPAHPANRAAPSRISACEVLQRLQASTLPPTAGLPATACTPAAVADGGRYTPTPPCASPRERSCAGFERDRCSTASGAAGLSISSLLARRAQPPNTRQTFDDATPGLHFARRSAPCRSQGRDRPLMDCWRISERLRSPRQRTHSRYSAAAACSGTDAQEKRLQSQRATPANVWVALPRSYSRCGLRCARSYQIFGVQVNARSRSDIRRADRRAPVEAAPITSGHRRTAGWPRCEAQRLCGVC